MIHGKLCHARVRYINFLNVPCIRKKTCEPGKIIPLSGNQCCLPPLIYLNRRNPEYHTSYLSFTILIRVAHDSLNREKFIKLILHAKSYIDLIYRIQFHSCIHRIHSKRIIWKFGTHYFPPNPKRANIKESLPFSNHRRLSSKNGTWHTWRGSLLDLEKIKK